MVNQIKSIPSWLQNALIRISKIHFWLIAGYAVYIIASDATALTTRDLVWQRWAMAGTMLIITTIVWFLARGETSNTNYYRLLIVLLVLTDIGLATFNVYTERGMASRGVALYALPIIISAVLLNRSAVFGTAALSTAAYTLACTRYFFVNFNEGYKAELYITLAFSSLLFFVLAASLYVVMREKLE